MRIADLTLVHTVPSAFGLSDLKNVIRQNALLNILNRELSRPVDPNASEIEYVPTQYLAEVILNAGYDGIRCQNDVIPTGTNIVFFKPAKFDFNKTWLVTVKGMSFDFKPL